MEYGSPGWKAIEAFRVRANGVTHEIGSASEAIAVRKVLLSFGVDAKLYRVRYPKTAGVPTGKYAKE